MTITEFAKTFGEFYTKLYEREIEEKDCYFEMGDILVGGDYKELANKLAKCRQDLMTSDREVSAFFLSVMFYLEQGETKESLNAIKEQEVKTYKVTTNGAKNINDFYYQFMLGDNILYSSDNCDNVYKYAKMIELENLFAGVKCEIIYEC